MPQGDPQGPQRPRTAWFAFCSPRPADVREGTSCRLHAHFRPTFWSRESLQGPRPVSLLRHIGGSSNHHSRVGSAHLAFRHPLFTARQVEPDPAELAGRYGAEVTVLFPSTANRSLTIGTRPVQGAALRRDQCARCRRCRSQFPGRVFVGPSDRQSVGSSHGTRPRRHRPARQPPRSRHAIDDDLAGRRPDHPELCGRPPMSSNEKACRAPDHAPPG
jgi:hypothetical protein